MRIRTHKNKFTTISNASVRDENLSWELVGFLAYCLSMPEDWEFHPRQMWSKNSERGAGQNKIYKLIKELIRKQRCVRVRDGYLNNAYLYEIFDDVEDCKKRIMDLLSEGKTFLYGDENGELRENNSSLKEKVQRHDFYHAEEQHANEYDITKKHGTKKDLYKDCITVLGDEEIVDNFPGPRCAAAQRKDRLHQRATPAASEQEPRRCKAFDPFTYILRNGQKLSLQTARAFAKYEGEAKERLLRNIIWYEQEFDRGVQPKKSHEQMLQWAIKNDMSSQKSSSFKNETYAKYLLAINAIPGMELMKTVVRIPLRHLGQIESIALALPEKTFIDILKKFMV